MAKRKKQAIIPIEKRTKKYAILDKHDEKKEEIAWLDRRS